jgi:hypothetical protein
MEVNRVERKICPFEKKQEGPRVAPESCPVARRPSSPNSIKQIDVAEGVDWVRHSGLRAINQGTTGRACNGHAVPKVEMELPNMGSSHSTGIDGFRFIVRQRYH